MMNRKWLLVYILKAVAVVQAAPIYIVRDLGTFGGSTAKAYAINSTGLAVGVSSDIYGYDRAFSSFGIAPQTLSTNRTGASAAGVNSAGTVVGTVYANGQAQATVWQNGTATSIGGSNSYAMGLNDSGQITGSANGHAFLYSNGVMMDLGNLGGSWSSGYSVNNQGQVAGYGLKSSGGFGAFLWSAGTGMQAIGGLGGANSYAMAVNDAGQVAGTSQTSKGYLHAFTYANGQARDLGTLGGIWSFGYGINAAGDIVGNSWISGNTGTHAFLALANQTMVDLNTLIAAPGWTLTEAYGINDSGQIVGAGLFNGVQHAFRLDLVPQNSQSVGVEAAAAAVPEPSTASLILFSLCGGLLLLRAQRLLRNRARGEHPQRLRVGPTE